MLGTSMRPGLGFLLSGTRNGASASSSTMTGMFMRNAACQLNVSMIQPPTMGPVAAPSAPMADQTAMAVRRWSRSRNMLRMSESVPGMIIAPEKPSSAREAMSIQGAVDNAPSTDASANTTAPMSGTLRRPKRSPRDDMVMRRPASISA